jgi:DNA polymerase III epsilon subunit-like protein
MLHNFHRLWSEVDSAFLDTETTGVRIGFDKAVSVAAVRFENQLPVAKFSSLVNPGIPIPPESTLIHGITDDQVKDAPTIEQVFKMPALVEVLKGAQPGAFNGPFDRNFVPAFCEPWDWPWFDALPFVRMFDRYERGPGRHKLTAVCKRQGIELVNAHTAEADSEAAGLLYYKLGAMKFPKVGDKKFPKGYSLGQALAWQQRVAVVEWERFNSWLSKQPPKEK